MSRIRHSYGYIDYSAWFVGTTVVDAEDSGSAIAEVGDAHHGSHFELLVCCGGFMV